MRRLVEAAEAAVVALAANDDAEAFDELVRRKQVQVRGLLRRLCRDRGAAEDLAQLVFVEVWKSLARLHSPLAFSAWLRRITINVWLQHARKRELVTTDDSEFLENAPDPATKPAAPGQAIDLEAALATLPSPVRLCIVLSYQEEMSHSEIAETTGIPLGTVKSHIARGSARLRSLLSDYGEHYD